MNNTIFYLVGHAGVGKLTIAREIGALTGAKVIDNHYVNNPIFNLIDLYRPTGLPEEVWVQVDAVRDAILKTIASLSPREWSFVFTHVGLDIPGDIGVYHAIRETAVKRGARFQPVRLTCTIEEHVQRIAAPERRAMLKDVSPDNARKDSRKPLLRFDEPHALDLDVTSLSPREAAEAIIEAAARRS